MKLILLLTTERERRRCCDCDDIFIFYFYTFFIFSDWPFGRSGTKGIQISGALVVRMLVLFVAAPDRIRQAHSFACQ